MTFFSIVFSWWKTSIKFANGTSTICPPRANEPVDVVNKYATLSGRLRYNDPELDCLEFLEFPEEDHANDDDDGEEEEYRFTAEDPDGLFQAMKGNHTIQSVVLGSGFTDIVIGPVWERFMDSALLQLQALVQVELLETCVPCHSIIQLLRHIPKLRALAIEDGMSPSGTTNDDIVQLADALRGHRSLQELVLVHDFCQIVVASSSHIPPKPPLQQQQQQQLLDPVLEAVSTIPHLEILKISNTSILLPHHYNKKLVGQTSLVCLGQATFLRTLDLSSLGLTDTHFQTIAQHIIGFNKHNNNKHNNNNNNNNTSCSTHLETLVLCKNDPGPIGMRALRVALEQNYVLQHLSVEAADDSLVVVEVEESDDDDDHHHHRSSKERVLKWSSILHKEQSNINLLLRLNRFGRGRIFNHASNTRRRDWFEILPRLNHNPDALYYMLREHPDLWILQS